MNAEQLNAIVLDLRHEVRDSEILEHLERLNSALQNLVGQPQHPPHQTEVQEARTEVMKRLAAQDYNGWGAHRYQVASEIGAEPLFGNALAERIEESFNRNAATPEVIRQDVTSYLDELRDFDGALENLVNAFDQFGIGEEALDPGEGEIGMVIPRQESDALYDFSKDLRRIDFEIKTLSQIITGSAESITIRTISSSDFTIFLDALPKVVEFLSNIVTSLRLGYEKLQELKALLEKARELGNTSKDTLENMEKDVENAMAGEVASVLAEIRPMYEAAVENGLAKEGFEVTLESTIKGISSRIDKGYTYSFRIGPPEIEDEENPNDEEAEQLTIADRVTENNQRLQQVKTIAPGQQVLPLEWQTPDPSEKPENQDAT